MYKDWTYQEVEEKAEAIKTLGFDEIYLSHDSEQKPWHLATDLEPGGTHRLDIATSVWFCGTSLSGIPIRWSFDIERETANGKPYYEIDIKGCRDVLAKLLEPCKSQFRKYLSECASAVEKSAQKYSKVARAELSTAKALRAI